MKSGKKNKEYKSNKENNVSRENNEDKDNYRLKTRKYYDDYAESYPENVASWRVDLLKKYANGKKNILELGCGTGNYLLILPDTKITGIDLSKESINRLKKRALFKERNEKNKNRIKLVLGDITKLPFRNKLFDICFSFSTLYYVKEINVAVKEISRVMNKDGVTILEFGNSHSVNPVWDRVVFSVPQFAWSRKRIFRLMAENNFEILDVKYRSLIPNFFNKFDNDFVKNRFLQRYCFRVIVIARKK